MACIRCYVHPVPLRGCDSARDHDLTKGAQRHWVSGAVKLVESITDGYNTTLIELDESDKPHTMSNILRERTYL